MMVKKAWRPRCARVPSFQSLMRMIICDSSDEPPTPTPGPTPPPPTATSPMGRDCSRSLRDIQPSAGILFIRIEREDSRPFRFISRLEKPQILVGSAVQWG